MKSALVILSVLIGSSASASNINENKRIVSEFYELSFNKHRPAEAMNTYVGPFYKQHNPYVADGKEPFTKYFTEFYKKNPDAHVEIKRIIAEKDLVVLHLLSKQNKKDTGRAVVDIFRVENGKIVEHWDVAQPVIESSANTNTMF